MADENTQDTAVETPAAESTPAADIPAHFKELLEKVENMTVKELNDFVKAFEVRFGVSATAVAVAAPGAAVEAEEEKNSFTIELTDAGAQKIQVIKAVKEALALGLKEAKDLVDAAPSVLKEGVAKDAAEEMKKKIEEAGGKVNLK